MQSTVAQLDRLVGRILLVAPQVQFGVESSNPAASAERAFGFSLVFSGARCIFQYVILPFILPVLGVAGDFAVHITLVVNLAAIASLIFSLRRFWQINYQHRMPYLAIALPALIILCVFLYFDLQSLV